MAKKTFQVAIGKKDYSVEVEWSRRSNQGQIMVNGEVVKAWGSGWWVPREVNFEIGAKKRH